jgi:hypothetical protein
MKLNEPIKRINLYQSVEFNKRSETYFSSQDIKNKPKVEIKFLNDMLIDIKNEFDHVIVPVTNLKCIHFYNDRDAELESHNKAEAKKKPNVKSVDIKRPR